MTSSRRELVRKGARTTSSRRELVRKGAQSVLRGSLPVRITIYRQDPSTRRTFLKLGCIRLARALGSADGAHIARGKRWGAKAAKIMGIAKTRETR